MDSVFTGICKKCGCATVEVMGGFEFESSVCLFCGDSYSREVLVDDDYYEAMSQRRLPEMKDEYKVIEKKSDGQGVIFISVKDAATFTSNCFDIDKIRINPHYIGHCYGRGFFVDTIPEIDLQDVIKEINSNEHIVKEKCYITVMNGDKLNLIYGDKIDFLRESNEKIKDIVGEVYKPIYNMTNELYRKSEKDSEKIIRERERIERKIQKTLTMDIIKLMELLESSPDVLSEEEAAPF